MPWGNTRMFSCYSDTLELNFMLQICHGLKDAFAMSVTVGLAYAGTHLSHMPPFRLDNRPPAANPSNSAQWRS